MKLTEYNWDTQLNEEVEYPDEIIKGLVDFMRLNKQWPERLEIMYNRYLVFQRDLTEVRNERALEAASGACTAVTASGTPCRVTGDVEDGLCHIHRRHLVAV